jgi:hypothetical protein
MNPAAPATSRQRLRPEPGPDRAAGSIWWLAAVATAFGLSQLLFVAPRMGLGWDEAVYVSQFSAHAPAAFFDAARARGVPLLVAPVTLVTSSAAALRGYLALASGLGPFVALWAWRRLRPAWVLALAGLAFGGLWVSQYYGPQAMPDEWVALSGLAAAGFFLQAATGPGRRGTGPVPGRRGALALGIAVARRAGTLGSCALAAACGLSVAVQYLFLISYAAPRFLLPAYALLAIPVADALAWLLGGVRQDLRKVTVPAVAVVVLGQLMVQHLVLDHEVSGTIVFHDDYSRVVTGLRRLGIRPPCLINGEQYIPIAFYAGCASAPGAAGALATSQHVAVLEPAGHSPPGYARRWARYPLPGSGVLRAVAYLPGVQRT